MRAGLFDVYVRRETVELDQASGYQQIHPSFQDQATGDVIVRLAGVIQKSLGRTRVTLTLRYGDGDTLDSVGPFVMNHAPWTGG